MRTLSLIPVISASVLMSPVVAQNQGNGNGNGNGNAAILIPDSSVEQPGDQGRNSHTNHLILFRGKATGSAPSGMSPQQIAVAYNFTPGGGGTIAIVDAYHYPTAYSDLSAFSSRLGLKVLPACSSGPSSTAPCFLQVYSTSGGGYQTMTPPRSNCGWAQEAALDIEWAHAMAPNANIVLVEAASNKNNDLWDGVAAATNIITSTATGKGEVSMSWGGSEYSGETSYDHYFQSPSVVYFASSGDTGGKTIYPGTSPYVVSAGGTSLKMNGTTFVSETGWSGSGGGTSPYEPKPTYQSNVSALTGNRGVPDFSFDADPYTGVSVYDTTSCQGMSGWMVFGGTSVSSPSPAGIVNTAGHFYSGSTEELNTLYGNLTSKGLKNIRDITSGKAGSFSAGQGWDFVTGLGSNLGLSGK